jgi:hypothetical protein
MKKRYREVWEDILLRRFFCPKDGRIRGDTRRSRRYLEHKQGDAGWEMNNTYREILGNPRRIQGHP